MYHNFIKSRVSFWNAYLICPFPSPMSPLRLWPGFLVSILDLLKLPAFLLPVTDLLARMAFAYKTETLGSLYSHTLLILLKSSKLKHQLVHEQKFRDLLSSTCQVSVERIVLDLKSEAAWVLFPLGVTFCHWIFFHVVKPLMPILPILLILSICEKLD